MSIFSTIRYTNYLEIIIRIKNCWIKIVLSFFDDVICARWFFAKTARKQASIFLISGKKLHSFCRVNKEKQGRGLRITSTKRKFKWIALLFAFIYICFEASKFRGNAQGYNLILKVNINYSLFSCSFPIFFK